MSLLIGCLYTTHSTSLPTTGSASFSMSECSWKKCFNSAIYFTEETEGDVYLQKEQREMYIYWRRVWKIQHDHCTLYIRRVSLHYKIKKFTIFLSHILSWFVKQYQYKRTYSKNHLATSAKFKRERIMQWQVRICIRIKQQHRHLIPLHHQTNKEYQAVI